MGVEDYLKDEIKRLNRMNDLLEKKINQGQAINNEPEQIVNNVNAMCQIAQCMLDKNNTPVAITTDANIFLKDGFLTPEQVKALEQDGATSF